jgi:hypothetical protein
MWTDSLIEFRRLVRRTRLLVLVLLLLYAFATPGAPLLPQWPFFSPTAEGLSLGLAQAWRLLLALLALSVLLRVLGLAGLATGLFALLRPFAWVGFPVDRFTVRLVLALDFARSAGRLPADPSRLAASLDASVPHLPETIEVDSYPLRWRDGAVLLCSILILALNAA